MKIWMPIDYVQLLCLTTLGQNNHFIFYDLFRKLLVSIFPSPAASLTVSFALASIDMFPPMAFIPPLSPFFSPSSSSLSVHKSSSHLVLLSDLSPDLLLDLLSLLSVLPTVLLGLLILPVCSFSRDAALVLVDVMLSLDELLLLNEAGTVDFSFSCHASLKTCLIAFPTEALLGLLGVRNLGLESMLAGAWVEPIHWF